ncbi:MULTISPECIES: DUF2098 domain-containing protein [Methanobacterium]|uniref:DUF2098 domain-containing protein n=2 Tax=Methanobacterium subterraneum TaxID=59277 RepID=A0A2H4VN55_9EURY|nr:MULTISPECIES: DUF2098 domain-containing protein [Methanobacterium]MBW4257203.1 DUF2098 domain-containing protein [Methanobacterium sp. YSL]PKL71532.1 MAG: DUF2098 domain-containing protein [Methanobacteriales archaeon HGW-Methanobacteriales-2]AUB56603.1 hypothetical protein BK007_11680 [Methanobacterium subterraneum]AUB58458.1 hypothetical protein BK008_09125 [Methanobacterium sp. MZ-A1]AUB59524.1 hypothetical protein BK009_01800 [Methanobacterium subterraneum]
MEAANKRNKEIFIGSHVRYSGTGSAGEVLGLKSDEDGIWVKVDTTQLWYNSRYLELMDEKEYNRLKKRESKRKTKVSSEKTDEKESTKKKVDKLKQNLEDIDMSSELCDGGG